MRSVTWAALLCAAAALPLHAQQAADTVAPEIAVELPAAFDGLSEAARAAWETREAGQPVTAEDWMVAAANPVAVEVGAEVLRAGGTAADAMVAVQAVLGLVEPQSSGLGGGAFLVWYDAATGEVTTLDGRETAPMAATPRLFQTPEGEPLPFWDAVVGGLSVGTPGTVALMEAAHRRWGQANWAGLLEPAIRMAEEGFVVSPRLAGQIAADGERMSRHPATAAYFWPEGVPLAAGAIRTNADYAEVLRTIAAEGAAGFYTGPVAEAIVAAVRGVEGNPGLLALEDLARYRVIERPPVCIDYRGAEVCGMGPPSSGALTIAQILGKLTQFDLPAMDPDAAETWRLIGDATRLAFADRGRYIADSDFVPVPVQGMTAPGYLSERAELLRREDALPEAPAGTPEWDHALLWAPDTDPERPSTSHISIVDAAGNALSMTTTIESGFGSRLFVKGFLLNNELTDFSFRSHEGGWPIANRVEPGKRPRSSMSPTIVLRDGAPVVVTGSPGGAPIISYTANSLIAHLDWGLDVQAAIDRPHLVNAFGTYILEEGTPAEALAAPLEAMGFEVSLGERNSGIQMIAIGPDGLTGGADRRREGIALGE
jgi:gamma-glutamyltranspeptidase/glutathione hydrolase